MFFRFATLWLIRENLSVLVNHFDVSFKENEFGRGEGKF